MGRNSYLGGHTLLHGGSALFSRRKKWEGYTINAEEDFLKKCIKAEISGKKYPPLPEKFPRLCNSIKNMGDIKNWLESHPDYWKKRAKYLARVACKEQDKIKEEKRKRDNIEAVKKSAEKNAKKKAEKKIREIAEQQKKERHFLESVILRSLKNLPPPQNWPKGFKEKYQTNDEIILWAQTHPDYGCHLTAIKQRYETQQSKQLSNRNKPEPIVVIMKKRR